MGDVPLQMRVSLQLSRRGMFLLLILMTCNMARLDNASSARKCHGKKRKRVRSFDGRRYDWGVPL